MSLTTLESQWGRLYCAHFLDEDIEVQVLDIVIKSLLGMPASHMGVPALESWLCYQL